MFGGSLNSEGAGPQLRYEVPVPLTTPRRLYRDDGCGVDPPWVSAAKALSSGALSQLNEQGLVVRASGNKGRGATKSSLFQGYPAPGPPTSNPNAQ